MAKVRQFSFVELFFILLVFIFIVEVLTWVLVLAIVLLHDVTTWDLKMADLVEFEYLGLGLGLIFLPVMGIKSRKSKFVRAFSVLTLVLTVAYVLYLWYTSADQARNSKKTLLCLMVQNIVMAAIGLRVAEEYTVTAMCHPLDSVVNIVELKDMNQNSMRTMAGSDDEDVLIEFKH
ncbi:hypothetical protein HDE_14226 [Halotydeus destructor]|nr:hypothetical protein HDE_14226 [Halotydeus destructor]